MIRFRERKARGEDVEGVLDLQVSDGCQQAQRVNESMLKGSVSLLLLLESNCQLLTFRAELGLRFMLDPPTHLRTLRHLRGGHLGLGAADTLSLLSAQDTSLCMKYRFGLGSWTGEAEFGSIVLFCVRELRCTN